MADTSSSSFPPALEGLVATLGPELVKFIREKAKLLVVGAGGIGCELLKNLALVGFTNVKVVDLDTIDVSNLNRQLLFRSQHVGHPKCTVACEVAAGMVAGNEDNDPSDVSYQAIHGNVCDTEQFHVDFCRQFDLVLNALDNVTARRRVNRLCLAAGVPLVEAGTTGYLGQVNVIDKESEVACYECVSQEPPKVYPICTIRSTPSQPVHTIVWAKECYKLLFADKSEESMLFEGAGGSDGDNNGEENKNEEPEGSREPSTYMEAVEGLREALTAGKVDSIVSLAKKVLQTLYVDEIEKQLGMDRYKTAQKTPTALDPTVWNCDEPPPSATSSYSTTTVWSPAQAAAELIHCCVQAAKRNAKDEAVLPSFDKDDDLSMRFVAAASNLRSHIFGIERQSFYACKGIAGNIIPAIATTNAICAGLQILQAINVLRAQLEKGSKSGVCRDTCRYINCLRNCTRNGLYLTARELDAPNPKCYVCQRAPTVPLTLNTQLYTLQDLIDRVLKPQLGFALPTVMLDGDIVWEEGPDSDEALYKVNLPKSLQALPSGGIRNGTVVCIEDFSQDLTLDLSITHCEEWEQDGDEEEKDDDPLQFVLGPKPSQPEPTKPAAIKEGDEKAKDDDDDVIVEVTEDNRKRPASTDESGPAAKKQKTEDEDIVVID